MKKLVLLVALTLTTPAQGQGQDAIADVISDQFRDFAADDFAGAFEHASPTIQGLFGSVDRFGMMVRQGYPMVWRYQSFRLAERREIAGALWQRVDVIDADGQAHALDYKMEQGADGWKIDAVQLLPAPVPNV